jgi:ubiquitin C-terminal hydrolase
MTNIRPGYDTETFKNYSLYEKKNEVTGKITDPTIYGRDISTKSKENTNPMSKLGGGYAKDYNVTTYTIPASTKDMKTQNVWKKLIGLENLGNTCFMNSSLQCLIHTEPFIYRLLSEKERFKSKRITSAFLEIIDDMIRNVEPKGSVKPANFKKTFGVAHSIYTGYSQQDSQEFLRRLFEDIAKEGNRVNIVPTYRELDTRSNDKRKINNDFDKLYRSREDSIVLDTFYGQVVNIFSCRDCKYETYSFEKFLDIPLLLKDDSPTDLSSLLNMHFEQEGFQWDSPCEKCRRKSFHTKVSNISYLPDVLILSLQRYNGRHMNKNMAKISFKETIDLKDYIDPNCVGNIMYNF